MGWVYAIQLRQRGLVKVGMTNRADYRVRLKELQTGQPDWYQLLAVWPTHDAEGAERAMHQLLAANHYRGEWFTVSEAQVVEAWARVSTGHIGWWYRARWWVKRTRRRAQYGLARAALVTGLTAWLIVAGLVASRFV